MVCSSIDSEDHAGRRAMKSLNKHQSPAAGKRVMTSCCPQQTGQHRARAHRKRSPLTRPLIAAGGLAMCASELSGKGRVEIISQANTGLQEITMLDEIPRACLRLPGHGNKFLHHD
jgi:hypothetical protein